jgi:hypothetical protein
MKLAGCLGRIFKLIGDREHADLLWGQFKLVESAEECIVGDTTIDWMEVVSNCVPAGNANTNVLQTAKDFSTAEFFTAGSSALHYITRLMTKTKQRIDKFTSPSLQMRHRWLAGVH